MEAIKAGLERAGLADLVIEMPQGGATSDPGTARKVARRADFNSLQIYLPKVLRAEGGEVRDLDHETDILAAVGWRDYSPAALVAERPDNPAQVASQLQRIALTDAGEDAYFRAKLSPLRRKSCGSIRPVRCG